ncbi:MAG: hypothetical protein Q9175_003398 [Cornicularia normoerica]
MAPQGAYLAPSPLTRLRFGHFHPADKKLLRNTHLRLASEGWFLPTQYSIFDIMLDPFSALSLACNIIQIVDFSIKAAAKFRELCRDGVSSENHELEDMAARLKGLQANLITINPATGESKALFGDEKDLQALAEKCCKTADDLTAELDTLKTSGPHKKRQAALTFFRSMRRKSVVEGIQRRLDGYRKVLDTRILINLRQRLDLVSLQQSEEFKNLDSRVQTPIVGLENKQSSFDALSDLIRQEQKSTKEHVTEEIHQYQRDLEQDEYCRKYLDSLSFPGIRARQEVIVDPYKETFQWIFDDSGKAGKAGSGKSTLMSYICGDQRTKVLLKTWAGTHELLVIPFFFWKAGKDSPMQKSSAGLLRSLLYQILEKIPHLILSLAQNDRDLQDFKTNFQRFALIPAWTEKHLLTTFQKLLVELSSSYHLCLFIDGLDEIDGSQNDLAELLQDMVSGPNLKICLSSRPDRFFIDAFSSPTMLRLEDVTRKDIILYVSSKLQGACRKKPWAVDDEKWVSLMTARIVQKARGVFQWVRIVVEYQIQGLRSKDSLKNLLERVELLPEEMEELYAHMLERIDKVHREEVASYLQIILQIYKTPSVSELALALYEGRDGLFSPQSTLPLVEIASHCSLVRERIKLICAGLLEFRDQPDHAREQKDIGVELANVEIETERGEPSSSTFRPNAYERAKSTFLYNETTPVHLIHRTAYDFLRNNPAGKEFLKSNISSTFDVYRSYIEARLAQLVIFAQTEDSYLSPPPPKSITSLSSINTVASLDPPESVASLPSRSIIASLPSLFNPHVTHNFNNDIHAIMEIASTVERVTNVARTALTDRIDNVVTMLDQQYFHQPPDNHWCTRWGFRPGEVDRSRRLGSDDPSLRASSNEPIVPLDFLSFATYHGLYLYVLDTLSTRFEQDDPDRMTILLRFTIRKGIVVTATGQRIQHGLCF